MKKLIQIVLAVAVTGILAGCAGYGSPMGMYGGGGYGVAPGYAPGYGGMGGFGGVRRRRWRRGWRRRLTAGPALVACLLGLWRRRRPGAGLEAAVELRHGDLRCRTLQAQGLLRRAPRARDRRAGAGGAENRVLPTGRTIVLAQVGAGVFLFRSCPPPSHPRRALRRHHRPAVPDGRRAHRRRRGSPGR